MHNYIVIVILAGYIVLQVRNWYIEAVKNMEEIILCILFRQVGKQMSLEDLIEDIPRKTLKRYWVISRTLKKLEKEDAIRIGKTHASKQLVMMSLKMIGQLKKAA